MKLLKALVVFPVMILWVTGVGCASLPKTDKGPSEQVAGMAANEGGEPIPDVRIREFVLSPGDEIAVTVLGYDELNRRLIIPPDGILFFPMAGEIDAGGKTLRQLREQITEGLAKYQGFALLPGDEIAIAVYRNEELNRRFIIPPDGRFFYPLVGEVDTRDKSNNQLREVITTRLSQYLRDPQVSVDIVAYARPKTIADPQVTVEVVAFGGQKVFVLGEVNRPGVFTVGGGINLVEAISKAGGFTLDAQQGSLLVVTGGMQDPAPKLYDLKKFLKGGDLTQNIPLHGGDIVYVPPSVIANVDRFFRHFATIITPIVTLETGIVLEPVVEDTFQGVRPEQRSTVIVPPR
ncbi:MAG: polysaccharide biosynthesis/export family protein [Nitrospirae bacterium]|nr:polysaccharide biosynthesis/export family protein [Nitrospirota bacterium]